MKKIRILLRNYADFENALEEHARLFESLHPGTLVELESVGINELHHRAIIDGELKEGECDLALLVTDWLAEGMSLGILEDLNAWQRDLPIADWPEGWPRSLRQPLTLEGKLSSIPWHDGPECLIYRSDLFADAARQASFRALHGRELTPPSDWEHFEQVARFFTDTSRNLYGTVFAGFPDSHNTLYDFALQIWSRGGEFVDATGHPKIDTPEAIAAIDYYRRIVRDTSLCHPRSAQLDSTQSGDMFLNGEVAMMVNWFGFAARSCCQGSPLDGKVAIAPIPSSAGVGHVSLSVFWAMAMGSGSRNKPLAWDFLRFIAMPERDLSITDHGAVGVRLSTWRNPELQKRIPVYSQVEQVSLNARQLPRGTDMPAFAKIIDSVLTRALSTNEPTPSILGLAQREIEEKRLSFS